MMTLTALFQQPQDVTVLVAVITAVATLAGVALGSILTHVFASRRERAKWEREQEEERSRQTRSILLAYGDSTKGFAERPEVYVVHRTIRVQKDMSHQSVQFERVELLENWEDDLDMQLAIEAMKRLRAMKELDKPNEENQGRAE